MRPRGGSRGFGGFRGGFRGRGGRPQGDDFGGRPAGRQVEYSNNNM